MEKSNKSMANRSKILKIFLAITIIAIVPIVFLILLDQSRSFYCISGNKCVTLWKRIGNVCYIIPGKYYGLVKPKTYIKTTNTGHLDIIWINERKLLLNIQDDDVLMISSSVSNFDIELYSDKRSLNDSLYTFIDEKKYKRYRNDIEYISIDINEDSMIQKNDSK